MVTKEEYDKLNSLYENNMIEYDTLKREIDQLKEDHKEEFNEFRGERQGYIKKLARKLNECKQKIDEVENDNRLLRRALKGFESEMNAGTPMGRMLANRAEMPAAAGPPPIPISDGRGGESGNEGGESGDEGSTGGGGGSRKRKAKKGKMGKPKTKKGKMGKRKTKKNKMGKRKAKKTKRSRRSSKTRRR